MSNDTRPASPLYGIWNAVKNENEWEKHRWMEWWPSQAAAFRSMHERLAPATIDSTVGNVCPTWYVFRDNAGGNQFYGSTDGSCITLYATPNAAQPCGIIEFGPRGGLRRRAYATADR